MIARFVENWKLASQHPEFDGIGMIALLLVGWVLTMTLIHLILTAKGR